MLRRNFRYLSLYLIIFVLLHRRNMFSTAKTQLFPKKNITTPKNNIDLLIYLWIKTI